MIGLTATIEIPALEVTTSVQSYMYRCALEIGVVLDKCMLGLTLFKI